MTYKFVRIDSSETCKVILPVGKHIIGRGKFLVNNADDNKVSRNHAELEVTADSVTVKSLHINPCFFIKNGTEETQVLSQDNTITLSNGDKFGILPQIYWYELIHCLEEKSHESEQMTHVENRIEKQVQTRKTGEEVETNTIKKENDSINFELDDTENGCSQESISLLRNQSPTQEYNCNSPIAEPIIDKVDSTKNPVKRSHSSEASDQNDEFKKARTESEGSDTTKAGPSDEQKVSPKKEVKDDPSQSPAQPPPTVQIRERCMYGANCYRKNVQHKAQFSHPQDSDWDVNQRQCPFGAGCRRRNPHHWRDYLHPAGVNPPNPNRPGKRNHKRSTTSDSEDSSPSKLIVTGKRVRKTVQREAWSDSGTDAEPDPYGSDDSEEWVPPSDATQTQDYSQEWD